MPHLLIVLTLQAEYRLRGTGERGSGFVPIIVAHLSAFVHVLHFASYSLVIQEDMSIMSVQKTPSSDLRRTNKQVLRPDVHDVVNSPLAQGPHTHWGPASPLH